MDRGRIASLLFRCLDRLTTAKLRVGMLRQGMRHETMSPDLAEARLAEIEGEIDQAARLVEDARLEMLPSP
jgi:hypothetical protein